jgi:hypothetical protein
MKKILAKIVSALTDDKVALMAFRAACRREGLDPDKTLRVLRVAAGIEPMPPASVLEPWEVEGE